MALTKPILYAPPAFDATQPYTFTFNVIGGDQVVANQLTIINQQTSAVVYQQKQIGYTFTHIVPANTLANGAYYSAYIRTYNAQDDGSAPSASIQFYCFAEPTWGFSNIPPTNIINNASFGFEVGYNQAQGELLSSYSISLYDDERIQISTSGLKYVDDTVLPLTVSHTFSGLNDGEVYYIRAIGSTANGMQVDTGYRQIFVQYSSHDVFTDIELFSNCNGGYVTIKSNLLNIEGISQPSPPIYIDDNTQVDATGVGDYVEWNRNFIIANDFTASLWGQSFNDDSQIIELSDEYGNSIEIVYSKVSNGVYRLDMTVTEDGDVSHVYSQQETMWAPFNKQQIWLRRVDGVYTLELHNLEPTPPSQDAILGTGVLGWMILGEG